MAPTLSAMQFHFAKRAKSFARRNAGFAGIHARRLTFRRVMLDRATAEDMVRALYQTLSDTQRREICLPWDYADARRGLVRGFIANHWQVTQPCVHEKFFNAAQRSLIFQIYCALLNPSWRRRFVKELSDDTYGHHWGQDQSIAIFGDPLRGKFQFIFTGRHVTLRVDGDPDSHIAFGGPIVYAHAATGFHEQPHHPGNIFWPQALCASELHAALAPDQRACAEQDELPLEYDIGFRARRAGAPVANFSAAQKQNLAYLLASLLEPFRAADQAAVRRCLAAQGGVDSLHIAFGRAHRLSAPAWDDWRLEGPSFIWHYRGWPHVHAWVHVAEHADVAANAHKGTYIFPGHDPLL